MQNILFFGDSLTAGYGLKNAAVESLPALIQQKINSENFSFKTINAGLSGDTTSGGLTRLDYWLSQPISIFVLELGINDVRRGIPAITITKNLQAIIDKVTTKYPQAKKALLGMEIPIKLSGSVAAEFNAIYRNLAEKNNMALVPFLLSGVAGKPELNLWDRLHPSAEGYQVIAGNVWPVLRGLMI